MKILGDECMTGTKFIYMKTDYTCLVKFGESLGLYSTLESNPICKQVGSIRLLRLAHESQWVPQSAQITKVFGIEQYRIKHDTFSVRSIE